MNSQTEVIVQPNCEDEYDPGLLPVSVALTRIAESITPLSDVEQLPVREALGRILAEALHSPVDVPNHTNSAMDGYALAASDLDLKELTVIGTAWAGRAFTAAISAGQCVRIMTGAPLPVGADAVVMVERTQSVGHGDAVLVEVDVPAGNHIRAAGEDLQPGDSVFSAGTVLGPGHLGVLASIGVDRVAAWRRPRVGVLSTGDELVDGVGPLEIGQIRDANRPSLLGLLDEMGVTGVDLGRVADDEEAIEAALRGGVSTCDAVLTSGGVSMGDFDYVKVVLDRIGDMRWMQVAIKPAKPLAFGLVDGVPVFGLPGNPVSSMVSFELFARPALRAMAGRRDLDRPRVRAVVEGDLRRRPDGKVHFARVVVSTRDDMTYISSAGGQGSHQLTAMAAATGLAVLPDGDGVTDGDEVEVLLLG